VSLVEVLRPQTTSRRRFGLDVALNYVGLLAPLPAGLVAVPLLLARLGTVRFGMLTLLWALTGYLSFFDLGVGRALTRAVAGHIGSNSGQRIAPLVWTGMLSLSLLGILAGGALSLAAGSIARLIGASDGALLVDVRNSIYWLAASLPLLLASAGARGVLEAHRRFVATNAVRAFVGVGSYLAPLVTVFWWPSLTSVTVAITIVRLLATSLSILFLIRAIPGFRRSPMLDGNEMPGLLWFGGWVTVSSILGPVLVYVDRLLIAFLLPATSIAYYTTPLELASRVWVFPVAVATVLFPLVSASTGSTQSPQDPQFVDTSLNWLILATLPLVLILAGWGSSILGIWLGGDFARTSGPVLEIVTLGILGNSVAQVPFAVLQGSGRPDLTGRLHAIEVLIYLPVSAALIRTFGIEGAAWGWTFRALLDLVALLYLAGRIAPLHAGTFRRVRWTILAVSGALAFFICVTPDALKHSLSLVGLVLFLPLAWRKGLTPADRRRMVALVTRRTTSEGT
jgi:O-antigen/teichoic acid export membrane protein